MWKSHRKPCNQDKLGLFLEAIENNTPEVDEDEDIESVSDAAAETNKRVQDVDDSDDSETPSFEIGDSEEEKKQIDESQFKSSDYSSVVDIIINAADKIVEELKLKNKAKEIKAILAKEFVDTFKADNPKFDPDKFISAVGE